MIRINLGKDALEKAASAGTIGKGALAIKIPPEVKIRLSKLTQDVGMIITILVSAGISASLPMITGQVITTLELKHTDELKILKEKLGRAQGEVQKFTPFQAELASYEDQKKVVSQRLGAVRELLDQRGTPINVLDSIAQALPPRTWISALEFTLIEPNPMITMNGVSYSNEEISDFVEKLQESVFFSDVVLEDVSAKIEDKIELRSFSLRAVPKVKGAAGIERMVAQDPAAK